MGKRFHEFLAQITDESRLQLPTYVFDMLAHIGNLEAGVSMATCGPAGVDANGAPV